MVRRANTVNRLCRSGALRGILGNFTRCTEMWEWCADGYGVYPVGTVWDPTGPANGRGRFFRGGAWSFSGRALRSAQRLQNLPGYRAHDIGLRFTIS